jgi:hypothetical protein
LQETPKRQERLRQESDDRFESLRQFQHQSDAKVENLQQHVNLVWSENSIPAFLRQFRDRTEAAYEAHTLQAGLGHTLSGVEAESRSSTQLGRSFRIVPRKLGVLGFCACVAISRNWAAYSRSATFIGIRREFYNSGSGAVVVVQHAAQALAALDLTCVAEMARLWADELVRQALMIALAVIVGDEVLNGCTQRLLPEEDHAI